MAGTPVSEDPVLEYLKLMAKVPGRSDWPYRNIADFVLNEGQKFDCEDAKFPLSGSPKECFRNAFTLMLSDDSLTYVEGYAMSVIPVVHAWCVTEDDRVVDPTWHSGHGYFGVKFNPVFVIKHIFRQREKAIWSFSVIDSWDIGFPLLSGEETGWRAA